MTTPPNSSTRYHPSTSFGSSVTTPPVPVVNLAPGRAANWELDDVLFVVREVYRHGKQWELIQRNMLNLSHRRTSVTVTQLKNLWKAINRANSKFNFPYRSPRAPTYNVNLSEEENQDAMMLHAARYGHEKQMHEEIASLLESIMNDQILADTNEPTAESLAALRQFEADRIDRRQVRRAEYQEKIALDVNLKKSQVQANLKLKQYLDNEMKESKKLCQVLDALISRYGLVEEDEVEVDSDRDDFKQPIRQRRRMSEPRERDV
eukprot:TRINITY_DN3163_c0_g1_i1.p1 TRINITY_DN3163_c0_g1~~TRINITY_DN3163_c0_g1_i1.p1  ORF type:complete len:263 (-),score=48.14 TRINITY_DN3163_c0_g1_i1:269-1057(-)